MRKLTLKTNLALRATAAMLGFCLLSTQALADVCQKDGGPFRIKVVRENYTDPYAFQICYASQDSCQPLGDQNEYTWEAISKARSRELGLWRLSGDKSSATALGLLTLLTLGQTDLGAVRLSPAAQGGTLPAVEPPANKEKTRAEEHRQNADVLANDYLATWNQCLDVPSIEIYKTTLLRALAKVAEVQTEQESQKTAIKNSAAAASAVVGSPRYPTHVSAQ